MIPNIAHFIFLQDKQQHVNFLFVHYVAVLSCKLIQKPEKIFFYYDELPQGFWWDKAKELVTTVKVECPSNIGQKTIKKTPHKADVLKMQILHFHGGVYLDLDTVCIRNYQQLLKNKFVISEEITECNRDMGFSNAVMMSEPNSKFVNIWMSNYEKFFNPDGWQEASTILPKLIYSNLKEPENITLLPSEAFLRPSFKKIEKIFEEECEIPDNLVVLHLWNQYSKDKYISKINDFSWAIQNSHTLYGKSILRLMQLF